MERHAQGESEINGLRARVARLRQMREGAERLLEGPYRLAVGRPRQGLFACLPTVGHGLVPDFAPQGMIGEPFRLLGETVGIELFDGGNDAGVEGMSSL